MNLPAVVFSLGQGVKCSICLDVYKDPCLLSCGHSYCKLCSEEALKVHARCPVCCQPAVLKSMVPNTMLAAVAPAVQELVHMLHISPGPTLSQKPDVLNDTEGATEAMTKPEVPSTPATNNVTVVQPSTPEAVCAPLFKPGSVVTVLPRLWPGINKPGGAAFVAAVHDDGSTYDVKYILGNSRDFEVPAAFIVSAEDLVGDRGHRTPRSSRRAPEGKQSSGLSLENTSKKSSGPSHAPIPSTVEIDPSFRSVSKRKAESSASAGCRICLLTSNLGDWDQNFLSDFCSTFNVELSHLYGPDVTHLVVQTKKNRVIEQRTMKYLKSLSAGKWILTVDWITDCLNQNIVLEERPYEINRDSKTNIENIPQKWRLAKSKVPPCLYNIQLYFGYFDEALSKDEGTREGLPFAGASFVLYGSFPSPGPPKSDIAELLWAGGAEHVMMLGMVNKPFTEPLLKTLEDIKQAQAGSMKSLAVCYSKQEASDFREAWEWAASSAGSMTTSSRSTESRADGSGFVAVNSLWILDCISCFKFLAPDSEQYRLL